MKPCISALLVIVIAISFFMPCNAAGINVDGSFSAREWECSESTVIVAKGKDSNCGVKYALMSTKIWPEESAVYFLFLAECSIPADSVEYGVMLSVCNSEFVQMTAQSTPLEYDRELYNFRCGICAVNSGSYACEVRVGFKYGVPELIPLGIRFVDASGEPSTVYSAVINNAQETQSSVTERSTTVTTRTTVTKKTTVTEYKWHTYIDTPRATTTRIKVTTTKKKAVKTTAAKTTKSVKPVVVKRVVNIDYDDVTTASETQTTVPASIIVIEQLQVTKPATYIEAGVNSNKIKQIVTAAIGAALFIIALWGTFAKKNKADNKEKTDE